MMKAMQRSNLLIAGALLAASYTGSVQAISQAEPGEALLIPYMLYDSTKNINTLTGITIPSTLGNDPTQIEIGGSANGSDGFTTAAQEGASNCDLTGAPDNTGETGVISWWFFDTIGNLQHKGSLFTGCDDFVALDWGSVVGASGLPSLNGMLGYMIIANNSATFGSNDPDFAMYADTMVINGNWQSAAYIPTLPMTDSTGNSGPRQGVNEIVYTGGEPTAYAPLTSGMALDDDDGSTSDLARFDLRYFLDPSLNGSTELVVWLGRNCRGGADGCDRRNVPVTTFDTDRLSVAGVMNLSKILNVVDPSTLARPSNALSGFVRVRMPEISDNNAAGFEGPDSAGVAFALIRFSTPGNSAQAQTILAHERGVK
ncbi:MAG: hypothetical protein P9E24_04895 [Candidatus Competibacter sp.]|nr:hypothetical protein [Candidatus Competibacter sp.]MDG4585706.1 hypothetical protein [Candidatus Competibacter sp.]